MGQPFVAVSWVKLGRAAGVQLGSDQVQGIAQRCELRVGAFVSAQQSIRNARRPLFEGPTLGRERDIDASLVRRTPLPSDEAGRFETFEQRRQRSRVEMQAFPEMPDRAGFVLPKHK